MKRPALREIGLKNFKAVRASGLIKLTPLTVFIGNNGSGKSSLIEGLETYQLLVTQGLDAAMQRWRGFENIRNKAVAHILDEKHYRVAQGRLRELNPVEIRLRQQTTTGLLEVACTINSNPSGDELFIQNERFNLAVGAKLPPPGVMSREPLPWPNKRKRSQPINSRIL